MDFEPHTSKAKINFSAINEHTPFQISNNKEAFPFEELSIFSLSILIT